MRKLSRYYLISLLSFCAGIFLFQSVASAQTQTPNSDQKKPIPTPTIFILPTASPTIVPTATPTMIPSPTPTLTPIPTATPTPTPTTQPVQSSSTDIDTLFNTFSSQYHVDINELKKIAECESGFNTNSNNAGIYLGMFQFSEGTWESVRSQLGLNPDPSLRTNAQDAIQAAAYMISNGEINAWENCK